MADTQHTDTASRIKQEVGDVADKARDTLEDKARTEAENMRDTAATQAQKAANAAEAAASEFDPNSLQARAIDQLASRIEAIASDIRGADVDRMARTVRNTAERNPLMFVAGAALVGFAMTRFLGSRQDRTATRSYGQSDPWSDDRRTYGDRDYDLSSRGGV